LVDLVGAIGRAIVEIVLHAVGELIVHGIFRAFHATARVVLPICTFGYVQAAPIVEHPESPKLFSFHRQDGTVVVGIGHAALFGMTFWIAIGFVVLSFR